MKEKIANCLIWLASKIYPSSLDKINHEECVKLGLAIHVGKKDIRKFRKEHSEIRSFRTAKKAIINDTKNKIGMSIAGTIAKRNLIHYEVNSCSQSATVSGYIGVYVDKKKKEELGI